MESNKNHKKEKIKKKFTPTAPSHLNHLPLFRKKRPLRGFIASALWAFFLKIGFKCFIRLKTRGNFKEIYKKHPRLILISNHASHLDAVSISAAIPFKMWKHLYISAAKDYWFAHSMISFFSKYCLNAIPIERKEHSIESFQLCNDLLRKLDRIWLILFPEGTRSRDDHIHLFKGGVSLFSQKTNTPILFLYIEGNRKLMPKGHFPRSGKLVIHVGPVQPPANIETIQENYKKWVLSINQDAYKN